MKMIFEVSVRTTNTFRIDAETKKEAQEIALNWTGKALEMSMDEDIEFVEGFDELV